MAGRGERRKFRRLPVAAGMLACELCQYTTDKTSDMQLHFKAGLRGKRVGAQGGRDGAGSMFRSLMGLYRGLKERKKGDPF